MTVMTDYWAPPVGPPAPLPPVPPKPSRLRQDLMTFAGVVVASVLLGAPAGLLWSAVAPRYTVHFGAGGARLDDLESTKAFVGADGSYLLVMLGAGLLCGALAWVFARRSGPYTVAALVVGGVLAALIAASVGVRPGAEDAIKALEVKDRTSGTVDLFLGKREAHNELNIRAPWAAVGWPVGALTVFLIAGFRKPEDLD